MAGGMHGRGHAWQEKRQLQWVVRILPEYILVGSVIQILASDVAVRYHPHSSSQELWQDVFGIFPETSQLLLHSMMPCT